MKKLILLVVLAVMGFTSSYGQGNFRLGVNAGLPIGDAADLTTFQLGADVAYMLSLADVAAVGPMVGYSHFFGDSGEEGDFEWEVDDVQFVPIAASGRFNLLSLALGLDLGYAVGLNDGNDGGFYYRPQVGFNLGPVGLIASYQGISMDGGSISSVNLGVEFGL
ncbi:hypothetical protein LZ575_01630 [Antarcticibacterium sp. 1MA-6-2]|uniref:hypothetical protein n=1 Tax=Antarcticibacterium sp. 1MA-6-2 TaxID=2908210 RepID=UPI001F2AB1D9|nr:hypothetical protein [Antarcticibacterium sp. 1MA-6-2]UJH91482.1 hypothetical protein LZ575_01630 [Antarcticibacterium sp. 1MA-6-2]